MTPLASLAAVAVAAVGALLAAFLPSDEKARRVGGVSAGLSAALAGVNLLTSRHLANSTDLGCRVDSLSAPLQALVAWVALAVAIALPRSRQAAPLHQRIAQALGTAAAVQLILCTDHAGLLALGWLLALLGLAYPAPQPGLRGQLTFAALVAGALGWLTLLQKTPWISEWRPDLAASHAAALFVLLALGAGARAALVPLQSWWLPLFEDGPLGAALPLMAGATGAYLLARVAQPLLPSAAAWGMPLLAAVALTTAVYTAFLALAQTNLRRLAGVLALLQSALQLVALAAADREGLAGVWVQALSSGLAVSGFALLAEAVRGRSATAQAPLLGGLVLHAPRLAWLLLVFGLGSIGLPGTLGFVGEDLIIHGLLEHHPWMAALVAAAMALTAMALIRVWSQACLGPASPRVACADLLVREQAAALLLAVPLLGFGLWPAPAVAEASRAAARAVATAADSPRAAQAVTEPNPKGMPPQP